MLLKGLVCKPLGRTRAQFPYLHPGGASIRRETMKKALVCGVSGQDGSYLSELLVAKGYEVWGTSRDSSISPNNLAALGIAAKVQMLAMAPTDARSVQAAIAHSMPDEIYYLAGQSSVGASFQHPVETLESIVNGVLNVLEAVRSEGRAIRVFNAGSGECFGDTGGVAADETTAFAPRSPYAVAKACAHAMVATYRESFGVHACTGILFNHESPLRPDRFVTRKIIGAAQRIASGSGERLTLGRIDVQRDWGWAPDYVDAMWRMLQLDEAQDFVLATGQAHPLETFVELAFAEVGLDWRQHVDFSDAFNRPTDIDLSFGNPAKAAGLLQWKSRKTLPDIVRSMMKAIKQ